MFRKEMDLLDEKLVKLLLERMALSERIAVYKKETGLAVHDPDREKALIDKRVRAAETELKENAIREIYEVILKSSRAVQHDLIKCDKE